MYHEINEAAAKRAREANSFYEYEPGSATANYRAMVDEAKEVAEQQKSIVGPMYHEKIDALLATYCRKMAEHMNHGFAIESRVPSILIAGGSNFPVRKKEKQNEARHKHMQEYEYIRGLLDKIRSTGTGGISADDPNAVEKLQEKLEREKDNHAHMKALNAYYRKNKTCVGFPGLDDETAKRKDHEITKAYSWERQPYPTYALSYSRAEQKRLSERIAGLEKLAEAAPDGGWSFDGGKVVINTEVNRVQILFDDKPDEEKRAELKSNGFRWAPSQSAWQRQYTANGLYAAKKVTGYNKEA